MLRNVPSDYGRLVVRPNYESHSLVHDDTFQDQIENVRVKISLKERYNRVLQDEALESRSFDTAIIHDLYAETNLLREEFVEALQGEKHAVQNALRTHREFQLTLTNQVATPWLEDKLFDVAKKVNVLMNRLACKRKRLEEVEELVKVMEKWPRPGSLPREMAAAEELCRLEIVIEKRRIKLETANILYSRYYEIKMLLLDEKGKYTPVIKGLQAQQQHQGKELKQLQKMLLEATHFETNALKKLKITEKEAGDNRKHRKRQMARIKKAVQKILKTNQLVKAEKVRYTDSRVGEKSVTGDEVDLSIRAKKLEVERFQDKTRRLVEVMKIPDLTKMPQRYHTVMALGQRFEQEEKSKEGLRDNLLAQQNTLNLILCHFLHTGQRDESEFQERKHHYEANLSRMDRNIHESKDQIQKYGELVVDIRLAVLSMLARLEDSARHKKRRLASFNLISQIKMMHSHVIHLVQSVSELQRHVPDTGDDIKNYAQYRQASVVQPRLIRVGTPTTVEDDSEGDEDFDDLKVPGR